MLWSIVQVERPSSSTSGGQSEGIVVAGSVLMEVAAAAAAAAPPVAVVGLVEEVVDFRIIAIHAEEEVQLRHLLVVSLGKGEA